MISSPSENDVDFEPEDEMGSLGAAKAKMQKLRDQLKESQTKAAEYLDGWQRAKADMVNAKKEAAAYAARATERGKEQLVEALIPALDGFDMAMQGESWTTVSPAWRSGMESIRNQIEAALVAEGIELFGAEGDAFDPSLHEPIAEATGGTPHTIAKVFRRGYRTQSRVIRPAQVSVFS